MLGWLRRLFRPEGHEQSNNLLAIEFDRSLVTSSVEKVVRETIVSIDEFPPHCHKAVYHAAIVSISRGRDLHAFNERLLKIDLNRLDKHRIAELARFISNRATVAMQRERQLALGLTHCKWLYSHAICAYGKDWSPIMDRQHKEADGKVYEISKGLLIDGRYTWPGWDEGCKCVDRAIVKEFP